MKVILASDHAGFDLKGRLAAYLKEEGYEVEDLGPEERDDTDDYPDFMARAAKRLQESPGAFAVVMGGSGQGEAMTMNRFKGVRAAVYYGGDLEMVRLARHHNDANALSLAARFLLEPQAIAAVDIFLESTFAGEERHARRIGKLDRLS